MKQLDGTFSKFSYKWWCNDGDEIKEEDIDALEDAAEDRIKEMVQEGYIAGILIYENSETDYNGWFE